MTTFDRGAIAEAVHQAVCHASDSDGRNLCAYYARAGAIVTSVVAGRNEYAFSAGGIEVAVGDRNGDGDLWLAMDPSESGYNGMEFHAWFVRAPAWMAPGPVSARAGKRVEVVDLAMRHLRRNAEMLGMPWRRESLPVFFWDEASKLQRLRVRLRTDPKTTAMCIERQPMDQVEAIVRLALKAL
jgi:hypothetical protein